MHNIKESSYEIELQRSEAKFRIVLETAAQGILLVNLHGQISLVNTKIEKLFGYSRDELIDASLEKLVPLLYRDIHVHHRNKYFANPTNTAMAVGKEINGKRKDGSEFPIEVHLTSAEMYDGLHVIAFITDISEQKKAAKALQIKNRLNCLLKKPPKKN